MGPAGSALAAYRDDLKSAFGDAVDVALAEPTVPLVALSEHLDASEGAFLTFRDAIEYLQADASSGRHLPKRQLREKGGRLGGGEVGSNESLGVAPRLVVFDAPSGAALTEALSALYPKLAFVSQSAWSPPEKSLPAGGVPLWRWESPAADLAHHARFMLHQFVYPLIAQGAGYCVAFPFGAAEFEPPELGVDDMAHLDFEDIGSLLCSDAVRISVELQSQPSKRLAMTPIEEQLARAFDGLELEYKPQAKVGDFRVDFLLGSDGRMVAVEADGRAYHDPENDRRRDDALKSLDISEVVHFTGSQIYRNAGACALEVQKTLGGMRTVPIRVVKDPLDQSQVKAAEHRAGAARVLAPAGSGKTRTMVNRVVQLIERGVDPSAILVLAFNRKAAEQLIGNLTALGVPLVRQINSEHAGVHVATFNALGFRYQKEIIGVRPRLASETGRWQKLMGEAVRTSGTELRGLKAKRGADPIQQFLKGLSRVRADLQNPADIDIEIESYEEKNSVVPFAPVEAAFQELQLEAQIQSFDDQIYLAVRDLLTTPANRRFMQRRYEHVLVDEYQDLNGAQLALVDILSRPYRNLFVVGDDDQLIYGWRFAKPANILDFHDRVPPRPQSATYTLSTNYRCSQAVVEASQRLIVGNKTRVPKQIRYRDGAPEGSVGYCRASEWAVRADAICGFLKTERSLTRCDWRELAVLCRYRSQQVLVAMALDRAGIPRTPLLSYRLFSDAAARLVRAYLQLVASPKTITGDALRLLINRPNRYVKNATVERIGSSRDPWAEMVRLTQSAAAAGELAPRALCDLVARTRLLHERFKRDKPRAAAVLADVLMEFGLEDYWKDAAKPTTAQQDDAGPTQVLDAVRMLSADFPSLQAFLTEWDRLVEQEGARGGMEDDTLGRERSEDEDRVVIGTIHSAKGREYQSVVVLDYSCDLSRLSGEQTEEERRVLYVAVTRAKERVLLTIDDGHGSIHPFFRELIGPAKPGEWVHVQSELEALTVSEQDAVIEREEARAELEPITSGTALGEAEQQLADLGGASRINELKRLLDDARRGLEGSGVWAGLSGKRSKLQQDVERYQRDLKALESTRRRALLLKGDPEKAAVPVRRRLSEAESQVAELAARRAALESRLTELAILGVEAPRK